MQWKCNVNLFCMCLVFEFIVCEFILVVNNDFLLDHENEGFPKGALKLYTIYMNYNE